MTNEELQAEMDANYNILRVVVEKSIEKTKSPLVIASNLLQLYYHIMILRNDIGFDMIKKITIASLDLLNESSLEGQQS